jgi:hypothetical protein
MSQIIGPIAHQQARFGQLTVGTARRHPVARCQRGKLAAATAEERVGGDEEGIRPLAYESGEGRLDLPAGAGVEDLNLQSDGACGFRYVSQHGLGGGSIDRIDQHRNTNGLGHQLMQEPQPT